KRHPGRVMSLILRSQGLGGFLSPHIGNLSFLRIMVLQNNSFGGEIPSQISNLFRLRNLDLSNNSFGGPIPSNFLLLKSRQISMSNSLIHGTIPSAFGNLFNLSYLSLKNNSLTDSLPDSIGALYNLRVLFLSRNMFTGEIPPSIGNMTSLNRLFLQDNNFQGYIPQSLGNCTQLIELELSNNSLSGSIPVEIVGLYSLSILFSLAHNNLSGSLPYQGGVSLNASVVSVSGNREFCGGVPTLKLPLCKLPSSKKSPTIKAIITFVVAISLLCLALLFLSIFGYCKKKQTRTTAWMSSSFKNQFMRISYDELLRATNRFSETNLIGKGRYGTVYMGILEGIAIVAVKVLNLTQRGATRSFVSECRTLGTIRHRNLDIRGNDFKALIYEFMTNRSLEEWLHPGTIVRDDEHGKSRNLRLVQRLNIAIDIAIAIEYLHKGCSPAIVHGDLKLSNVLLDDDMVARVGDFGLAKIISTVSSETTGVQDQGSSTSTIVRGSIGYVAPPESYGMGHQISTLGDAYSYDILLLEMFTGKRPTEEAFGHCLNLHSFVQMALPNRVTDIVDSRLWSEANDQQQEMRIKDCIISIFEVGVACSIESPLDRMDMTEAIRKLYSIKASYEIKERTGM
ncbi:hypothetical protein EUGRSUZ_D01557, partial [Eucalyptus grandis]